MGILKPKRGDVWWVNFDPSRGSEAKKIRPAIVISNDKSNRHLSRVQVVPITSNIDKVYPSECLVFLKKQQGKAMVDQLKTVSLIRCQKKVVVLSVADLKTVEQVLKVQLGL
jgi:mRNA interferase MazF